MAPCCSIRGTKWVYIPNILHVGLSCRADDTINERARQFIHGCSYLPGDNRIQSGLRVDSEVLVM
eukprot:3123554-Pyramimonas_sp.AAC.1